MKYLGIFVMVVGVLLLAYTCSAGNNLVHQPVIGQGQTLLGMGIFGGSVIFGFALLLRGEGGNSEKVH